MMSSHCQSNELAYHMYYNTTVSFQFKLPKYMYLSFSRFEDLFVILNRQAERCRRHKFIMSADDNVRMMTAPAPTPAYQEDNVAKLQRVN